MKLYKVLVVDDSALMRRMISEFIESDPLFHVIDTAKNGQEAIDKTIKLEPDIITLDVTMPVMDGVEALRQIMEKRPTPVIMLSSLTHEGTKETMKALNLGAIDFVGKPTGQFAFEIAKVREELLEKINTAVKVDVSKQKSSGTLLASTTAEKVPLNHSLNTSNPVFHHLVAIGTSTGGPRALQQVLKDIPKNFLAPIVIVQHMPPNFTKSLAQRLDGVCQIGVCEAEDGQVLRAGVAYIAPGGHQMRIKKEATNYRIKLSKEEPRNGHRPSVDVLFESLLNNTEIKRHIVIMTGMGNDGAKGMLDLKRSGAETTIAEAKETCVVYGMPRAAVELNCTDYVLPLQEIAKKLIEKVSN